MSDLLLEFYSEEIPARMQEPAAEHLKTSFSSELSEERLSFESVATYSTPRRLVIIIWGLAQSSNSFSEERRGPRVGAPPEAISGFANSVGVAESELYTKKVKKGEFHFYDLKHPGYSSEKLIKKIAVKVAHSFPWQKSMKWGEYSFRWVRPLKSIMCMLYHEGKDPRSIDLELNGIISSSYTYGHQIMSPEKFYPLGAKEYMKCLRDRRVILDYTERKNLIWASAKRLAEEQEAELIRDDSLLDEVAGLVEWPVILMGDIDEEFLTLPREILQVSMREHQKFFSVISADTGLLCKFVVVANLEARDGGKSVLEGNSRVLRSRLRDAKFFFNKDLIDIKNKKFEYLNQRLEFVTFHHRIGSQAHRVQEIRKISGRVAKLLSVNAKVCDQAVNLCKTDLTTNVVREFPELQGVVGRIYCKMEGEDEAIYNAVSDHYKPLTQNDQVPEEMVSIVVGIADRVFTLTSFWAINEKPSGSKDPFALRRSAIGLIRILLEKRLSIKLTDLIENDLKPEIAQDLCQFIAERLRIHLIEKGYSHDTLQACLNLSTFENPYAAFVQIEQLEKFRKTELFHKLIDAYRRPNNILHSEENKAKRKFESEPSTELFNSSEENNLMDKLVAVEHSVKASLAERDYVGSFGALADLNEVVEAFFENVTINSLTPEEKENRLYLCNKVRKIMHSVANFSELRVL